MSSFLYLFCHTFKNRIRKALKKPATYVLAVFIVLYVFMIFQSLGGLTEDFQVNTPRHMAMLLSLLIFFILPSNLISYSKRKGLLFQQADVHFLFPAPLNPKMVLLYVGIKNLLINILLGILVAVFGMLYFHTTLLQTMIYVITFIVTENVLEGSIMVLCYGNEKLPERVFVVLPILMYALMGIFVVVGIAVFWRAGNISAIGTYLSLPVIQLVPLVGWNIALIRLIFVGPTVINLVGTVLFLLTTVILFFFAYRVECVGAYYEDAAKFADDYVALKQNRKKGYMSDTLTVGKKKKYKKATISYKGTYAKAIYYRQMLEYKKNKMFIFSFYTIFCLVLGIAMAVFFSYTDVITDETARLFVIPGIMAYIVFIFSGYNTKWSKELENPYTYLIPDSNVKKMWYATKMEHIRALVDGILLALPGSIVLHLNPLQFVCIVLLYVCLLANKLYYYMLADLIIGNVLGNLGRTLIKMLIQMIAITIAAAGALVGGIIFGPTAGLALMVLFTFLVTMAGALIASFGFEKMEVMD